MPNSTQPQWKKKLAQLLTSTPVKTLGKSFNKYTFGFRAGSKLQKALDSDSETTIKDATLSSLKDTAKSTGSIYASQTIFSVMKITFLESALGSALMSSTFFLSGKTFFLFLLNSLSQTFLGVLYTSLSATLTLSFTTFATMSITFLAGTQVGKFFSSTVVGEHVFNICRFLVPIIGSILPLVFTSMVIGYIFQQYKKMKAEKNPLEEIQEED